MFFSCVRGPHESVLAILIQYSNRLSISLGFEHVYTTVCVEKALDSAQYEASRATATVPALLTSISSHHHSITSRTELHRNVAQSEGEQQLSQMGWPGFVHVNQVAVSTSS